MSSKGSLVTRVLSSSNISVMEKGRVASAHLGLADYKLLDSRTLTRGDVSALRKDLAFRHASIQDVLKGKFIRLLEQQGQDPRGSGLVIYSPKMCGLRGYNVQFYLRS